MRRARPFALTALALATLAAPALAHAAESNDLFSRALRAYGWLAAVPAAFVVGLATAATPCVYPMIAITVSVFGARKESRGRAMALSTAFVLGIAAMFVPLGLAAGLSGSVAGSIAGNPLVQVFEAALMFAMAASMFGVFEISLPGSVQNRLASIGGLGLKGAFLIGLATGPIAAPCATAGLVGILDYVFRTRNAAAGAGALFAYSLGLGFPFWIVGTFAIGLPKPGRWMDYVKNALGLVLVVIGLYYVRRLVPGLAPPAQGATWMPYLAGGLLVAGLAIGAVHLSLKGGTAFEKVRKTVGIVAAALGAVWLLQVEPGRPAVASGGAACTEIAWQRDLSAARTLAQREGRPMVIDFGAFWCEACEHLAHRIFPTQTVTCATRELNFVTVKLYEEDTNPEVWDRLQQEFGIRGLPTVIVLDGQGREVGRVTGEVPADQMAALLRRVDQRQSSR